MSHTLRKTIHVACRELGLDQDDRRALQLEVCGKASMSDMDDADMELVVKRLKKDGFKLASNGRSNRPLAPRSDLRLIHVLWKKLGDKGVLEKPNREGLNAFVRSSFGEKWGSVPADVDMLRDADKINAVVRALKAWGKRADIDFDFARTGPRK